MSQRTLETDDDLLRMQLRVAMTMEHDSLAALQELSRAAVSADVRALFEHHADETRHQLDNLRATFSALDLPESTAPSPGTKGIARQARAMLAKSDRALHDQVAVSAALGTEHYEIAAYESLITAVTMRGVREALTLLRENRDQEEHTSKELASCLRGLVG